MSNQSGHHSDFTMALGLLYGFEERSDGQENQFAQRNCDGQQESREGSQRQLPVEQCYQTAEQEVRWASKKEAKVKRSISQAKGKKTYVSPLACPRGHWPSIRYNTNHSCAACLKERNQAKAARQRQEKNNAV
jgi:hypothetical protein